MKMRWIFICALIFAVLRYVLPGLVWDAFILLAWGVTFAAAVNYRQENDELVGYVDELLEEQIRQSKEAVATQGARLAVTESGAVEFANDWKSVMPEDTVRDFVVKFDGWDKSDWTMWVRLPWGKYQKHKAEIDFTVGRNVMKESA